MLRPYRFVAPVLFSAVFPAAAHAQDVPAVDSESTEKNSPSTPPPHESFIDAHHPGFGARIGGYSFRSPDRRTWDDCPMGGAGLFATLDLSRHFYVEAAADSYQIQPGKEPGMDRVSFLATTAAGVRLFPDFYVVPHLEIGGGVEWTRVEEIGQRIDGAFGVAFIGVGAEINVLRHIKGGADFRFLGMSRPYEDTMTQAPNGAPNGTLRMELAPASQGLFYLRYVL